MHRKISTKFELIIGILIISIFVLETAGYAHYNQLLGIAVDLSLKADGEVVITNVVLNSATNAIETATPIYSNKDINLFNEFNVTTLENTYEISYNITIANNTHYDYVFTNNDFNYSITVQDDSSLDVYLDGIAIGDTIPKLSEITFSVTIRLNPNSENTDYDVNLNGDVDIDVNDDASLLVAIRTREGDLSGSNTLAHFEFDALNGFDYSKTFNLYINSSLFELCDRFGNPLSTFTIDASDNSSVFDFYVKKIATDFSTDVEKLTVMYSYDTYQSVAGTLNIKVDKTIINDTTAPVISNVKATQNSKVNSVHLTWRGYDESSIDHYVIQVFKSNGTKVRNDYTTIGNETFIDVAVSNGTSNNDGEYYFKVYGIDRLSNTASNSEIANATVSAGHCSRSATTSFKWYAKVSYTGSFTSGSVSEVLIGSNLSTTISGQTLNRPNLNYITMNGVRLNSNQYTTSGTNNLTIKINNVTGDIVIDTNGQCLIEGTKILLADGTYKNIEDIGYYDLLAVWSYDTGKLTYEYPIWIEEEHVTDSYQLNVFSDGTILKTLGYHGIYNYDLNKFVSVDNINEFYVGSTVAKIENGQLKKVTVTDIKIVNETVKYYHVVSSRYYNIIANDILTTDGTVILSNIIDFDDNIKWVNKDNVSKYSYSYFSDIVPYYMYYGMRMEDAVYLNKFNFDLNKFKLYLKENQLNETLYKPLNSNGDLIFKISTSDGISEYVKENYLFVIPGNDNIYLNTLDNKIYKSNDILKVVYSSHLIKIK